MKQLSYPRTSSNFGNSFLVTKASRSSRTEPERCVSSSKLKRSVADLGGKGRGEGEREGEEKGKEREGERGKGGKL